MRAGFRRKLATGLTALFLLAVALSQAAAATIEALDPEKRFDFARNTKKSLACGRVQFDDAGLPGVPQLAILVVRLPNNKEESVALEYGGGSSRDTYYFCLIADPGQYVLKSVNTGFYQKQPIMLKMYPLPIAKTFAVGQHEVLYIGDLAIRYRLNPQFDPVDLAVEVSDRNESTGEWLKKRLPQLGAAMRIGLLK